MRKSSISLIVLGLVVVVGWAVGSSGVVVSAQNSNSSTTMAPATKTKTTHRTTHKAAVAAAPSGRCDPMKQEQTDLSGTYTGKLKHGDEAAVDATLTITGNTFSVTAGSDTHSGRITAVTTCGYTAVTLMSGDMTTPDPTKPAPPPAMTVSLRAKKVGNSITLTSVPGETRQISFTSGGAAKAHVMKPRTKRKTKTDAPPKTEE